MSLIQSMPEYIITYWVGGKKMELVSIDGTLLHFHVEYSLLWHLRVIKV